MSYTFQKQYTQSYLLLLFHIKPILIQLKSTELFPLTPANIYWCPKFLTNQGRSLSVALNEQTQRVK